MPIKASKILKTVKKLGKKHPDRRRKCHYFASDGTPCCIVGEALAIRGVDPAPFLADRELNQFTDVAELFKNHAEELGLTDDLENGEMLALYTTQSLQDRDFAWGVAVDRLPE